MNRLKLLPFFIYKISGNSMLPNYKPDEKVLGLHWFISLNQNDVIITKINDKEIIKRIKKIEKEKLWLEGDNEKESTDSRTFGWINKSAVIAKVIMNLN